MSSDIQRTGGSSSSSSPSYGKQRRRYRQSGLRNSRKINLLNIDIAEARKQVCHALLLHRNRFPSSSSTTHDYVNGTTSTQLLQSIPQPEPVWSTTAPSVLPYSGGAAMEAADIEFEWGENQASAYAWWLAFLKSLDGNNSTSNTTVPHEFKYSMALGSWSSNWFFGQKPCGNLKVEEPDEQIPSPDEWLVIPTTENHDGEFNHVIHKSV